MSNSIANRSKFCTARQVTEFLKQVLVFVERIAAYQATIRNSHKDKSIKYKFGDNILVCIFSVPLVEHRH